MIALSIQKDFPFYKNLSILPNFYGGELPRTFS